MANRKTRSRKTRSRKTRSRKRGGADIRPTFYKNDPHHPGFNYPPPIPLGVYFNRRFRILYQTRPDEPMMDALGILKHNGIFSLDTNVNDLYLPNLHSYQLEEI
jgi:hypothetical protein